MKRVHVALAFMLMILVAAPIAAIDKPDADTAVDPIRLEKRASFGAQGRIASPLDEPDLFPGYRPILGIEMPPMYYPDEQPLNFYIDVSYPHPHVDFDRLLGPADGYPYGNFIQSCAHQAGQHKVHCTGTIPVGNPQELVDPNDFDFFFVVEGTCHLYTDHRSTVPFVPSSDLAAGQTYQMPVEPILGLTVEADSPTDGEKDVLIESNGQGPLLQWHDQGEVAVCGDGSDPLTQDITYKVYLQKQGKQPQRIGDQQGECGRQIRLSEQALSCLDDGKPAPWTWNVEAIDVKYSACVEPYLFKENKLQFTTASCQPEITDLQKAYDDKYYLNTISVDNEYRVEVDWNGEAYQTPVETPPYGWVYFAINGQEKPEGGLEGVQWGARHELDMGNDFRADWAGGSNVLKIWATYQPFWATTDIKSEELEITPIMVFPFPQWAETLSMGNFTVKPQGGVVEYQNETSYPKDPFSANVQVPRWVPYLGGKRLGLLDTQAQGSLQASSAGEGSLALQGGTGLGLGGFDIVGTVGGEGAFQFITGEGLKLVESSFSLSISTPVQKEMTLAELVPGLRAAEDWWLVGKYIRKIIRAIKVSAQLVPKFNINTHFRQKGHDQWAFDNAPARGEIAVSAQAEAGYKEIHLSITGGGTPFVELQLPPAGDWGYLKQVGIDLFFEALLRAWYWEYTFSRAITCSLPQGSCYQTKDQEEDLFALASDGSDAWRLMSRDYDTPGYHTFVGGARAPALAPATAETPLITNLYPLAEPSLALRADGRRTLAYVHDDPTKPLGQGQELMAIQWDGWTWTDPISLTDDLHLDFSPQVVYDGADNGLVVWERSYTEALTGTLGLPFVQQLDIGALTWHDDTGTWDETPTMLTYDDGLLDHSPRLRAGYDGAVLALWETSSGLDLLGSAEHPITYTYATWDGAAWSPATPALTNLSNTLEMDVAVFSASQAALVYAVDTDGVLSTSTDTELFYSLYDGTAWAAPTRLTSDAVTDTHPALIYDADGSLKLLWLRQGDPAAGPEPALVMLDGSLDVADLQVVRPDSTGAGFFDLALARSPEGHLALIWQAAQAESVDLAYSVYDAGADEWGADQHLMSDDSLETDLSPAIGADGNLCLAYRKVQTEYVTETFQISPTLGLTVTNLPRPGRSDLYLLDHPVGYDLALNDLTITPTYPGLGEGVSLVATVKNSGDLRTEPAQLRFYDGSTLITATLVPSLTSGTTVTATADWTAPAGTVGPHTLRATVDPTNLIVETSESNNSAEVSVLGPRLVAEGAARAYTTRTLTYTLYLVNVGASPTQAEISLRAGAPDGPVVASTELGIGAGIHTSATLVVDDPSSLVGLGGDGWLVAGPLADDQANAWPVELGVWPDLALTTGDVRPGDLTRITVHNLGLTTATSLTLAVWSDAITGTALYSQALTDLEPGASAQVTFVPTGLQSGQLLWGYADPGNHIVEMDENNNLAARTYLAVQVVYLPVIIK